MVFHFLYFNDNLLQKIWQKTNPALEFLANNNTMWCHIFPKFCTLILKFSYIFSNFANGNVNFSTFETIWLISTPRHMYNEEILTISQQNITLLQNFSSKLISYSVELLGKKYTQENAPGRPAVCR